MNAEYTLSEIRLKARRLRRLVVGTVLFCDDRIATVSAGPRGGWKILGEQK